MLTYSKGTDRGGGDNGLNDCITNCNIQQRIKGVGGWWDGVVRVAHQNTHNTVDNKKRIRNLMLDNKLTVNRGQSADNTVRDQAAEASLSAE